MYSLVACSVRLEHMFRLGRKADYERLKMERKLRMVGRELRDPSHPREEIQLDPKGENLIIETIVGTQDMNIW